MSNCKNCGNPIQSHSGRRPREFCDNNQKCRNEWFRKNKKGNVIKVLASEVVEGKLYQFINGQLIEMIENRLNRDREAISDAILDSSRLTTTKGIIAPVAPENNAHKQ